MKRHTVLIGLILTLLAINLAAQNHLIGIRGGANWTNISSDLSQVNYERRIQIIGGITYEYLSKKGFSIGASVMHNPRSYFVSSIANRTYFNYEYVAFPVKVGFPIFGKRKIFPIAKVGLIPALLTDAKQITEIFKVIFMREIHRDITNNVSRFDIAGLAEIGLGYKVTEKLWLTTSLLYQYSFTSLSTQNFFNNIGSRHNSILVDIGVKWALKNK